MPVERRGQAIRVMINLVNWQQEELTGCGGGRSSQWDGTSRVSREAQARFREGLGVKLPGATRPSTEARDGLKLNPGRGRFLGPLGGSSQSFKPGRMVEPPEQGLDFRFGSESVKGWGEHHLIYSRERSSLLPADYCQLELPFRHPADTNGVGLEIRYVVRR